MKFKKLFKTKLAEIAVEILMVIPCFCICIISRFAKRDIDVGLGPLPLINNVYHKAALNQAGFSAETFVIHAWFITDEFDLDLTEWHDRFFLKRFIPYYLFFRILFRYRVLFIYFNGGPFILKPYVLKALEPYFYRLAKVKIVVMAYGGDVQLLTRCKNLYYRHALVSDYPTFWETHELTRKNIDRWTSHANWVIGGGASIEYLYHWNTLLVNCLSIDTRQWAPVERKGHEKDDKLRILHAPNHKIIKGTDALIAAVELLKSEEGLDLELILLQGVPNTHIRNAMVDVDLVADQFVIGAYGLFAIEAMAMGKPVLCYLREDLVDLYVKAGVVAEGEIPLINTNLREIAAKIRWAYDNREELREIGKKGREFVEKHHSTESIGRFFAEILNELGI
jgi:glycosyltransferase involved in cell wall biosynthesis